ncbi:MAG TPA: hypothetical protein VF026_13025 [Ktedonobacteraceae bacterium]
MISGHVTLSEPHLLRKSYVSPREKRVKTTAGPLILHSFSSPSLVASLTVERGLHAFAHLPEREHRLLLGIAERPDCALTLAYTPAGEIIGQVTLAPADAWWQGLVNTYEIAVEVSDHWRQLGLARRLLSLALEPDAVEEMILVALGLSWHWDIKGTGLSPFDYRSMLRQVFEPYGFAEYQLDEPNIRMDSANILLVCIGKRVKQEVTNQLFQRMSFFS